MSEATFQPRWLTAAGYGLCAAAVFASWLQPLCEVFTHGAVLIPRWWPLVSWSCLLLLLVAAVALTARYRRLGTVCWVTLLVCLGAFLVPGYA